MEPNFHNGDYLIIDEISYQFNGPQRGDVVVFKYPQDLSQRYIKRIVGLPGETIEIKSNEVFIYDENGILQPLNELAYLPESTQTSGEVEITLNKDEYFVLGDNRAFSSDSRRWGALPEKDIIGKVLLRAWPLTVLAKIEVPSY